MALPWGLTGKESTCQCRVCRFNPRVRESPWRGKWQPLRYSCRLNPMDKGAWWDTVHANARVEHGLVTKRQTPTMNVIVTCQCEFTCEGSTLNLADIGMKKERNVRKCLEISVTLRASLVSCTQDKAGSWTHFSPPAPSSVLVSNFVPSPSPGTSMHPGSEVALWTRLSYLLGEILEKPPGHYNESEVAQSSDSLRLHGRWPTRLLRLRSTELFRQEYWTGLPFPSANNLEVDSYYYGREA